jgi:anaerobic selenocysteine-containing dehydrogenase
LADLVLPAAMWAEKTGTFTNADRTVHISHKAIEPPGQARSDFDIFREFAQRLGLKDKDGQPLIKWTTPEEAFEHFKRLTRGRPCDYSGLTYAKLSEGSGIQWPCNAEYPEGKERLYEDGVFNTASDYCEIFGHDLLTGAPLEREKYQARDPAGRAIIKAADCLPLPEAPDDDYPLFLTTGRLVYHFHTRTKTGRSRALHDAAPDVYVELSETDAQRYGVVEGDRVEVATRRGQVEVPVRVCDIEPGHIFIPFHYGYWDDGERARAANELTLTGYDPVSKQPFFKFAAARLRRLSGGEA